MREREVLASKAKWMNVGKLLLDKYRAEFNTTITETEAPCFLHIYSHLLSHWSCTWIMNYEWIIELNTTSEIRFLSIRSEFIYHTHTISSQESELYITSQIEQKLFLTNLNSKSIIWNPLYFQLISDIFSFLPCCLSFWKCIEI